MFNKNDDIIKPPITFPEQNAATETPQANEMPQVAETPQITEPTPQEETTPSGPGRMVVEDVFSIKGRGQVATGKIETGSFRVGQSVTLQTQGGNISASITAIEAFHKILGEAKAGDSVGIMLSLPDGTEIERDDIICG